MEIKKAQFYKTIAICKLANQVSQKHKETSYRVEQKIGANDLRTDLE